MTFPWSHLKFWTSGEWQVVQERLNDLQKAGKPYNPKRKDLFKALSLVPYDKVRVAIMGQDPYPGSKYATGVAFSIPKNALPIPPTLQTIFEEYSKDLGHLPPETGDLTPWCEKGVLLWNVYPTCLTGHSLSHRWNEWTYLTNEIIEVLCKRGVLFVFLGSVAREFAPKVDFTSCEVLEYAHPSPRASLKARSPFLGSRLFSTINDKLVSQGVPSIDWRL